MFGNIFKRFSNRHKTKPQNASVSPELEAMLTAKIGEIQESPYFSYALSLTDKVKGKAINHTVAGTSGFILHFSDSSWVAAYLEKAELRWRLGNNDSYKELSDLINSSEYGNGYNPLNVDVMYANEKCNIPAQLKNSHGKTVTGLSVGANCFNFCFPDGNELNTTIVPTSEGKVALRVFWEQF